ncbi:unnamed protein product [Psylliodes chrysocephalus]|uniref:15-hydroxyprostaglandin dehydrogenase [NAD(+)]-like n=1 Tax=Psylliodes chrysocephalus TaxID=3402493 RepID=A0A9P0GGX6_9CUCU|nr:unnamed protein product [Psylliodes chrysocephala]
MVFEINEKVALITGGANGIGLNFAKALLSKGLKGVTLADVNENAGIEAEEELNKTYGKDKAFFVKTDVVNYKEFEAAFKATVEKFSHIDILINNAGIGADGIWRKEVEVNVVGTINGMILGMDNYLNKYKISDEGVIINTSSTCGLEGYAQWPVYSATKFAITGMVQAWGSPAHYERTRVRVLEICPSATETDMLGVGQKFLSPEYEKTMKYIAHEIGNLQTSEHVAAEMIKVLQNANNGTIWVIENGEPSYEYVLPKRQTFKNKN